MVFSMLKSSIEQFFLVNNNKKASAESEFEEICKNILILAARKTIQKKIKNGKIDEIDEKFFLNQIEAKLKDKDEADFLNFKKKLHTASRFNAVTAVETKEVPKNPKIEKSQANLQKTKKNSFKKNDLKKNDLKKNDSNKNNFKKNNSKKLRPSKYLQHCQTCDEFLFQDEIKAYLIEATNRFMRKSSIENLLQEDDGILFLSKSFSDKEKLKNRAKAKPKQKEAKNSGVKITLKINKASEGTAQDKITFKIDKVSENTI
ncbi:uncharacterized protein ASCRUDRAFT_87556 [Ascoidea rubescens DSM 1968]|uniref:Uncharacterized protein n=1 Tax=Ascoidea rubescens DSM 1968 TaxID=1344418 RepID=A0A1D2VD92_9ASCO|nr:hypothetical protein ASCRUDRAFT_87556 [Ascoidea rubescens DSM 1968]ODV59480.1 hypothetical protein ASCRUDRAFT_87556 [Ascoidea rubescens DSM 1968]